MSYRTYRTYVMDPDGGIVNDQGARVMQASTFNALRDRYSKADVLAALDTASTQYEAALLLGLTSSSQLVVLKRYYRGEIAHTPTTTVRPTETRIPIGMDEFSALARNAVADALEAAAYNLRAQS